MFIRLQWHKNTTTTLGKLSAFILGGVFKKAH
jgi:hypothetical protein